MGHDVQARWLDGKHQLSDVGTPIGDQGEKLVEDDGDSSTEIRNAALRAKFAADDFEDVLRADVQINFTETPRSGHSRGGSHVELGLAMADGQTVIVVGHRENIFHWLPCIDFHSTWESAKESLRNQ